ncbi:MAG: T9SS type A sorting domain-containing protein, partial [Candidatus Neomarinimicrobiota bacterium]|nr:T9SS type A sorting domain-containing protein [Candidatus Neomarinimicrobiota bacterium]
PDKFSLQQNYPNPFNPVTNIRYSLERSGDVKLDLINLQGQTVATYIEQNQQPGDYEFVLDGSGLSNGVYFYRLTQNRISKTRKMVLMK